MSYDIYLFKSRDGESVEDAYERVVEGEGGEGPGTPEADALKERLASALIGSGTGLERAMFDYAAIASMQKISEEEARTQFRHIELNSPEDGNGVQTTIEDESASILIPYWHQGDDAREVFEEVWQYLKVFEKEAGYLAYDPQLEKQLDLSNDMAEAVAVYSGVISAIPSKIAETDSASAEGSKPWWKFW